MSLEPRIFVTTREPNTNVFEPTSLVVKLLVLISDSEVSQGDMAVLKQIIGGDHIMNRIKYVQGSTFSKGMLCWAESPTYYLCRRPGYTTRVPYPWRGPLATELSDLIRAIDSYEAERIIKITKLTCPAPGIAQGKAGVNPLSSWASEELVEGEGAYVGLESTWIKGR